MLAYFSHLVSDVAELRFYSGYKFYWRKNVQTSVDWYLNLYLVMFTFVCDTHNSKSHSDIWQNRYAVLNCFHLLMWVAFLSRVNWGPPFGNSLGKKKRTSVLLGRMPVCFLVSGYFKVWAWSLCQSACNQGWRLNCSITNPNKFWMVRSCCHLISQWLSPTVESATYSCILWHSWGLTALISQQSTVTHFD